jgi:hypothetical protein
MVEVTARAVPGGSNQANASEPSAVDELERFLRLAAGAAPLPPTSGLTLPKVECSTGQALDDMHTVRELVALIGQPLGY